MYPLIFLVRTIIFYHLHFRTHWESILNHMPRGDSDYISILSPLEITHFFSSYIDPTFLMAPFSAEVAEERGRSREESAANGA